MTAQPRGLSKGGHSSDLIVQRVQEDNADERRPKKHCHWRIPRLSGLHSEVDGDAGREQSKALARRRSVGSRHRTRAIGFGSESGKNAECPIRGRGGAPSFRFRCCFLDGKSTRGGRNGDAVITADRSKTCKSLRNSLFVTAFQPLHFFLILRGPEGYWLTGQIYSACIGW